MLKRYFKFNNDHNDLSTVSPLCYYLDCIFSGGLSSSRVAYKASGQRKSEGLYMKVDDDDNDEDVEEYVLRNHRNFTKGKTYRQEIIINRLFGKSITFNFIFHKTKQKNAHICNDKNKNI